MNEWARLVDRYAAELKKYEGAVLQDSQMLVIDPNTAASNQRADEFLQNNAQLTETVKELYELCQQGSTQTDLLANFKLHDSSGSGHCQKDDFTNAVFDTAKGIKPAKLMALLLAFSNEFEECVNYGDFIRLIERQGEVPHGLEKRNIQMQME